MRAFEFTGADKWLTFASEGSEPPAPAQADADHAIVALAERMLRLHIPGSMEAPRTARLATRELVADHPLAAANLDSLTLLVSEVVTNAVTHPALTDSSEVEFSVTVTPELTRVLVSDGGPGFEWPAESLPQGRSTAATGIAAAGRPIVALGSAKGAGTVHGLVRDRPRARPRDRHGQVSLTNSAVTSSSSSPSSERTLSSTDAHSAGGVAVGGADRLGQPPHPDVERLAAPLDQPIGIEHEDPAGGDRRPQIAVDDVLDPHQTLAALEVLGLAIAVSQQRRRVPCTGPGDRAPRRVDDRVDDREQLGLAKCELMAVEPGQHLAGRAEALVRQREGARHAAQLAHRRGREDSAPGDVAEHYTEPAAGQGERVVPVAPDLGAGRLVVRGELQPADLGQPLGQQAALQLNRDAMLLLVQLRLADSSAARSDAS